MGIEWTRLHAIAYMILLLIPRRTISFILNRSGYRLSYSSKYCAMSASDHVTVPRVAKLAECDVEGIRISGEVLKAGGLVAFPTETVYGLGANALNDNSVKSIFEAKKRPSTDPLIVHILSKDDIYDLYDFEDSALGVSKAQLVCEYLAKFFWPGPLTIIFKAKTSIPLSVTAGSGFVGLRSPRHPIARQLLEAAGLPIAAPSANRFGHVSPTSSDHVMLDLGDEEITILKDDIPFSGGCTVGIESTVCRVSKTGNIVSILRCGAVTSEDIAAALKLSKIAALIDVIVVVENEKALIKKTPENISKEYDEDADSTANETAAVAPGQMIKHYAPDIPTYIVTAESSLAAKIDKRELSLVGGHPDAPSSSSSSDIRVKSAFIIDFGGQLKYLSEECSVYCDLSADGLAEEACNKIFEVLRRAEDPSLSIPKETTTGVGEGVKLVLLPDLRVAAERSEMVRALWERLHRAASGTYVY